MMDRLGVARMLPKIQRRLPPPLARLANWQRWQDRLHVGHWLESARKAELQSAFERCSSPRDFLEFAARFCPAHQIPVEILGFLELARTISPTTVLEIGTAEGGTNFLLGALLPHVSLKIGADLFVRNTRLLQAFCRPGCRQVFVDGSSHDAATVERIRGVLSGRALDLLFIDGDHRYAGAKADFDCYAPLVRPGGLIAFHDIVPDYRTRFGRETGRWAGDVPRLWNEIKARYQKYWEFVEDREQDGLGIGAVMVAQGSHPPLRFSTC